VPDTVDLVGIGERPDAQPIYEGFPRMPDGTVLRFELAECGLSAT